jgi:transposase-like protein
MAVVTLSKSGFSMRDVGQLVGVSHQRVDQILKESKVPR